jgi:UrcA family protein
MSQSLHQRAAAAFALSAALLATSALATAANEVVSRTVRFGDLDISHRAGAAVLYARIRRAAREVCDPVEPRALASLNLARTCEEQAIERAINDVGAPQLRSVSHR